MKHKLFRTLALICAAAFLVSAVPLTAVAAEVTKDAVSSAEQGVFDNVESPIQSEDKTQRDRNTKYFRCEDGTFLAAMYNAPVHYQLNGQWEDIDNTLIVESSKSGAAYYTNKANDFRVHLPAELNSSAPASVEKDGYTLSWVLQDGATVSGRPIEKVEKLSADTTVKTLATTASGSKVQKIEANNMTKMTLSDRQGSMRYEKAFNNTELRYDVVGDTVKESLILDSVPQQTSYTFVITAKGLRAELQSDKSVLFYETNNKTVVFSIAAPYMFDKAGEYSTDINVSLRAVSGGYQYTIRPSRSWLLDTARQYPVTIDPTIQTTQSADAIIATETYTAFPDKNYGNADVLYAGSLLRNNTPQEYRTFVKLAIPNHEAQTRQRVVSAKLIMSYYTDYNLYASDVQINLHQVTAGWGEQSLTWNNMPSYASAVTDYIIGATNKDYAEFDITPLVDGWFSGSIANHGIMLKGNVVSSTTNRNVCFYSDNVSGTYTAKRPVAVIAYRECMGLEDYWTYTSLSVGRGATAAVNNATGALTAVIADCGVDGNLMPVSISHVYNPFYTGDTTYGSRWRLNYQMSIERVDDLYKCYYKFIDGDGTTHYMIADENNDDVIRDEDGLGLSLLVNGTGSIATYTLYDKDYNQLIFSSSGKLASISDCKGNSIAILHTNDRITSIYDGATRTYTFNYDTSGKLTSIVDPANRATRYAYTGDLLTTVTYPDGAKHEMTYNAAGELVSVSGNGQKISASYDNQENEKPKRVTTLALTNTSGNATAANYSFDYQFSATTVTDNVTNTGGNRYTYQFNNFLQTVCVVSHTDGSAKSYKYGKPGGTHTGEENKLLIASDTQQSIVNHIRNPRADTNPLTDGSYSIAMASGQTANVTWDSTKGHTAVGSFKVTRSAVMDTTNPYVYARQDHTITANGYYAASAFATTLGVSAHGGPGAMLRLERWNGDTYISSVESTTKAQEWELLGTTLYCEAGDTLRVLLGTRGDETLGGMWFDDIQLEYQSETINSVNLLENTDFSRNLTGWTQGSGTWSVTTNTSTDKPADATKVVSIAGSGTADRYLYQSIAVNGKKGDAYSVGAWAKSTSVYIDPEETGDGERAFSIRLDFYNGTTKVNSRRISFNRNYNGWQFVSGEAIADGAYTKVQMRLEYNRNANTALFALPYLYKDNYGQSYKYDKQGNVISVEDKEKTVTAYDYTDNRLSKLAYPTGSELLMTYSQSTSDLLSTMDTNGQRYVYDYDDVGNITEVQMGSDDYVFDTYQHTTYYLRNAQTANALENNDEQPIITTLWFADDAEQQFMIRSTDEASVYTIHPVGDFNTCLTVANSSSANGASLIMSAANNTDSQLFKILRNDNRTYTISTKISGYIKCLDERPVSETGHEDNTVVTQRIKETDRAGQQWYLIAVKSDITSGEYTQSNLSYTSKRNYLHKVTDELGNTTTYNTDAKTGNTDSIVYANGTATKYYYNDAETHLDYVAQTDENNITVGAVEYDYTNDRLTDISLLNGTKYSLQYDSLGRSSATWIGEENTGIRLAQYLYSTNGLLSRLSYGNGAYVEYAYDALGRQTGLWYNGVYDNRIDTVYNDRGLVGILKDNPTNTRTRYWYDLAGRLVRTRRTNDAESDSGTLLGEVTYGYEDATSRLTNIQVNTPVGSSNTSIRYAEDLWERLHDAVYRVTVDNTLELLYVYDELGRRTLRNLNDLMMSTTYTYTNVGGNRTSSQIASIRENGTTTSYTYDTVGNIATVKVGNTLKESYTYDSLNQLKTAYTKLYIGTYDWTYSYDDHGNILSSTVDTDALFPPTNYTYTYGDTAWPDKLTAVNGNTITYDAIGNPLQYWNGKEFNWTNGRQLSFVDAGSKFVYFTYNADGGRNTKMVNGVTTQYYYVDGVLYAQKTGDNTLFFLYDEQGVPFAVKLNGTKYYYQYNLQGDVVGLYDGNGEQVVRYEYSPWGKLLNQSDSSMVGLANLNPLRYRGYYYDSETGFYLTGTRYYDPEIGRFINADGYVSTGQGVLGNNMFAYCGNNPVNRADPTGMFWKEIGDFFSKAWNGIKTWAKNTFGAGSSTTATIAEIETPVIPDPSPVTVKTGTKTTQTISKHGDSSKPISVYANKDAQHPIKSSSAGININIVNFTLDLSVGLDDIGISGSLTNGNTTNSFGVKLNLSELKIGFEGSTAIQWDNTTETAYTNASISGWAIAAAYILATTGQYVQSPSYAY